MHAHQDTRSQALPRLTASRLALVAKCDGSFTLAHDDHENPAAEKGTAMHRFLEALLDS